MAGETVTVGCKIPNGMVLQMHDKDGNLTASHYVAGSNSSEVIGGHGITMGVPKDLWDAWVSKHQAWFEPLKRKLIFAHGKPSDAAAQANEHAREKTGLEGLDPTKPGRGDPALAAIQRGDENDSSVPK